MAFFDKSSYFKKINESNLVMIDFIFLASIFICLVTDTVLFLVVITVFLILLDKKYIYFSLLSFSLVETQFLVSEGITITKFTAIFIGIIFLVDILKKNKIMFNRNIYILFLFSIIIIIGTFQVFFNTPIMAYGNWDYNQVLYENITNFSLVFFSILLIIYTYNNRMIFIESIMKLPLIISLLLIIFSIYFLFFGRVETGWWGILMYSLEGARHGEISALLSSLSSFSYFLLFVDKSIYRKIIALVSVFLVLSSLFLLGSRNGIISFLFVTIIFVLIFIKTNPKKNLFILLIICCIFFVLLQFDIFYVEAIYERFFGNRIVDLSSLTSKRYDWWKAAFNAFREKPLLGYGGSKNSIFWVTSKYTGYSIVTHNIFTDLFIQYGLIGLSIYISIIIVIFKALRFILKKAIVIGNEFYYYTVPFIALFSALFSGLALSWLWQTYIWILFGICLGLGFFAKERENE